MPHFSQSLLLPFIGLLALCMFQRKLQNELISTHNLVSLSSNSPIKAFEALLLELWTLVLSQEQMHYTSLGMPGHQFPYLQNESSKLYDF